MTAARAAQWARSEVQCQQAPVQFLLAALSQDAALANCIELLEGPEDSGRRFRDTPASIWRWPKLQHCSAMRRCLPILVGDTSLSAHAGRPTGLLSNATSICSLLQPSGYSTSHVTVMPTGAYMALASCLVEAWLSIDRARHSETLELGEVEEAVGSVVPSSPSSARGVLPQVPLSAAAEEQEAVGSVLPSSLSVHYFPLHRHRHTGLFPKCLRQQQWRGRRLLVQ